MTSTKLEGAPSWTWKVLIALATGSLALLKCAGSPTGLPHEKLRTPESAPASAQKPWEAHLVAVEPRPGVKQCLVELKPDEWSPWVPTPLESECRFDADTPTGKYLVQFQGDDTIYEMDVSKPKDFGVRRAIVRFKSEKGGQVMVTTKGGWNFSDLLPSVFK